MSCLKVNNGLSLLLRASAGEGLVLWKVLYDKMHVAHRHLPVFACCLPYTWRLVNCVSDVGVCACTG